jgi:hypothetical protein
MESRQGGAVRFAWVGKNLNVEYPGNERVFLNNRSWQDVRINYRDRNLQ